MHGQNMIWVLARERLRYIGPIGSTAHSSQTSATAIPTLSLRAGFVLFAASFRDNRTDRARRDSVVS